MDKKASLALVLTFLSLVTPLQTVSASGVGASPDRIDYGVLETGEGSAKSLYIINTGDEVERIVVVAEAFEDMIEISASEFTLNPKEIRLINITMDVPSDFKKGGYSGSFLVTGFPVTPSGLGSGASVQIPVEFSVDEKLPPVMTIGIVNISCVCLLIMLLTYIKHNRTLLRK